MPRGLLGLQQPKYEMVAFELDFKDEDFVLSRAGGGYTQKKWHPYFCQAHPTAAAEAGCVWGEPQRLLTGEPMDLT